MRYGGKEAKTATEHRRNTIGTAQQPPPSGRGQQTNETREKRHATAAGDGQSISPSLFYPGETPTRRERKKRRKKEIQGSSTLENSKSTLMLHRS